MLLYTVGVVYLLARAGLWTPAVLKETIVWFCFTGFVLTISTVTDQGEGLFKKVVKESIKVVLIFEFLINEFVFPLPVELVLVPFAAFMALVDAVARRDEKHATIAKLTGTLLAMFGLFLLVNAFRRAVEGFAELATMDAARKVLLAPTMSLLFVPFLYLSLIYSAYEQLFIRFRLGNDRSPDVVRRLKRRLVMQFGLNVGAVRRFHKAHAWDLTRLRTDAELENELVQWRDADRLRVAQQRRKPA
jgi:signal transduction histidine kinase